LLENLEILIVDEGKICFCSEPLFLTFLVETREGSWKKAFASKYIQAHNQGWRGPPGKCVGHSLKLLGKVKKI